MGGRLFRWALLGVALAVLAAGCGGKSTAEKRTEFLAKANSTCKHFEDLQNQVQVPSVNPVAKKTTPRERAQWALGIKNLAYYGTQEIKALRKLDPPDDLTEDLERFLTTKGGAFASMLEGADAAKRSHVSEIAAPIAAAREGLSKAGKQARALGLKECE